MMQGLDNYISVVKEWIEEGCGEISVTGLVETARPYLLSEMLVAIQKPWLILLPHARDASRFFRELEFFLPGSYLATEDEERRLYDFPTYDISPLAGLSPHRNVIKRRIQALYALTSGKNPIIVTSVEAILLRILPKDSLINALEYLEPGEEFSRDDLVQKLETGGYLRTSLVEEVGDYTVRGGVMDIFPPLYSQPVRLEFWGDRLESIRHFDPVSQRTVGYLKEMILLPSSEVIMHRKGMERARSMGRLPEQGMEGRGFPGQEAWLNHFYHHLDSLFDYFSSGGLVTLIDPPMIESVTRRFTERFLADIQRYRREAEERGIPFPETRGILLSREELFSLIKEYQQIEFRSLDIQRREGDSRLLEIKGTSLIDEDLDIRLAGKGRVSMAPLAERISEHLKQGIRVILVCRTEQQAERLKEILYNYGLEIGEIADQWYGLSKRKMLVICLGRLSKGFSWPEAGICVVSEDEIFGPKRAGAGRRGKKKPQGGLDWASFSQLNVGDLVVHEEHGIGRYCGLVRMDIEDKVNDFAVVEYADNDKLYTPADRISILQKYVGADEREPRLDRLGGRSWNLAKKKAKKAIREIAKQLVETYAIRKYRKGFAFSRPDGQFREFEAAFEHEETPDQVKAIDEVFSDMESDSPMDRLVCGDVGFGKTEVAVRASFKAVMDGKQATVLVPTTVLAEQHYDTFMKRMKPYQIDVAVLSRFKSVAEQKKIIARTRSGKVNVLIGTHRLLQKDLGFKDLGILIIDEEHRFGVRQKERLKKYRALVDVLTLTATPIPRTLHLSLMGVRDLSIIETPPEERLAIQSYLSHYDEGTIKQAIEMELERGGQVFFVHNRVKTIDDIAEKLKELVPGASFAVAHGQMRGRDLEETMIRFLHKEIDVLVCTTIIESGLDIPSSNTIIINGVDRMGLSQIYQLRGRVGRSSENAYAYLLLSKDSGLTREAEKRLKALMDFSRLGSGIHLAMHDLKIRGGGNILGFSQTGHITAIGYELYLKLTEQAIAELKGEEWHEETNPEINLDIQAYLPEEYVPDIDVRLNLYRRLSSLKEEHDLKLIAEEMADRFGVFPVEVTNLLKVMEVRLKMKRYGISRLDITEGSIVLTFSSGTEIRPERVVKMVEDRRMGFRFLTDRKIKVKTHNASPLDAIKEAGHIIKRFAELL
jgi:transcription-repair coupling factor (superfamily II helicase)